MGSIERGRSRRRGDGGGSSLRNAACSAVPTVGHQGGTFLRKQASYPGILSDPLFEAGNRQSRKASGVLMKMLIDEEISKDVSARHISPGAVGRLMGLDSLPTSGTHNQCRAPRASSPGSSQYQHGLYRNIPHQRSADDIKDIFEVMEASKIKTHQSPASRSGITSSRSDKSDDTNIDFIRQKFMDAKRLFMDESLHMSEEFNETLDALVYNRDLLVEFLRKFDPVVRKDLHNHGSLSSTANCITVLKPSRGNQFTGMDKDDIYPQGKDTESYFNMQTEVEHSLRKPYLNVSSECLKEDSGSSRQKLPRSSHQENTKKQAGPTRIVVLKPILEKDHDAELAFALNHKVPHFDFRRYKECQDVGRWSPYTEEYSKVSLEDSETLGQMRKGSREIAREIMEHVVKPDAARGESRKHVVKPDARTSVSEKRSQFLSTVTKVKTSDGFHRPAKLCDTWASSSFNSSPTYSTETSASKEAKKHLSNRWKKAHQHQHQITDNDGLITLGDMLDLSDQDTSAVATRRMACQKCPKEEVQTERNQDSWIYPLGISSNDGWRDVPASDFTRSKSLPPSFSRRVQKSNNRRRTSSGRHKEFSILKDVLKVGTSYSEHACRSRQRQSLSRGSTFHGDASDLMSSDNEERMVTEREIRGNYEEPADGIIMPDISEQSQHPVHLDHELDAVGSIDASSVVPERKESVSPAGQIHQMLKQPAIAFDDRLLVPNLDDLVTQVEDTPPWLTVKTRNLFMCDEQRKHQADDYPAKYNPQIESESFVGTDNHQVDDNQTLGILPNGSDLPELDQEFVDMVWQNVVQLRQEIKFNQKCVPLDVEWAGSEDGTYMVGSDIGSALQEDLIDEIIDDLLMVTKSAKLHG